MRPILRVVCLFLISGSAVSQEPKGGVADKALLPSDLGAQWTRRVQFLFDSKASPSEIFQVVTNTPSRPTLSANEVKKLIARQKEQRRGFEIASLSRLGAEAHMILEYYHSDPSNWFTMQIYRYKTAEGLEDMWKRRKIWGPQFNATNTAGEEVIYGSGQTFPGGVNTSRPSVEAREGVYHVMVSPGQPEPEDPGFRFLKKQLEKLRNSPEPHGSANAASPHR